MIGRRGVQHAEKQTLQPHGTNASKVIMTTYTLIPYLHFYPITATFPGKIKSLLKTKRDVSLMIYINVDKGVM